MTAGDNNIAVVLKTVDKNGSDVLQKHQYDVLQREGKILHLVRGIKYVQETMGFHKIIDAEKFGEKPAGCLVTKLCEGGSLQDL